MYKYSIKIFKRIICQLYCYIFSHLLVIFMISREKRLFLIKKHIQSFRLSIIIHIFVTNKPNRQKYEKTFIIYH